MRIKALKSVHKQFKAPFIFKKKDYVNYVKSEMNEVKKLVSIFKVLGANENPDEDLETLKKIEENRNETDEQSYYSTDNNNQNTLSQDRGLDNKKKHLIN